MGSRRRARGASWLSATTAGDRGTLLSQSPRPPEAPSVPKAAASELVSSPGGGQGQRTRRTRTADARAVSAQGAPAGLPPPMPGTFYRRSRPHPAALLGGAAHAGGDPKKERHT